MQFDNLGIVERKVLGALLILAKDSPIVEATSTEIADAMGYKTNGGALTFALRILEKDNFLVKLGKGRFKLLI